MGDSRNSKNNDIYINIYYRQNTTIKLSNDYH
jgi:hypothetical protein